MTDRQFEDKVVIITGAGGGIGRAAAIRFAKDGAHVVLVDLPGSSLAASQAAVEAAGGVALPVEADVSRMAEVERYAAAAIDRFARVDFLFNNAGIGGHIGPFTECSEEIFDQVLAVNIKGVWLGMKVVAPLMATQGGGVIINSSSVHGLKGAAGLLPYCASKHAVIGMTRTAAIELAPCRIRVNAVCAGPIETNMMRMLEATRNPTNPDQVKQMVTARVPLARYGDPIEVANMVAFLCSNDAAYISGAAFPVDGAFTA